MIIEIYAQKNARDETYLRFTDVKTNQIIAESKYISFTKVQLNYANQKYIYSRLPKIVKYHNYEDNQIKKIVGTKIYDQNGNDYVSAYWDLIPLKHGRIGYNKERINCFEYADKTVYALSMVAKKDIESHYYICIYIRQYGSSHDKLIGMMRRRKKGANRLYIEDDENILYCLIAYFELYGTGMAGPAQISKMPEITEKFDYGYVDRVIAKDL